MKLDVRKTSAAVAAVATAGASSVLLGAAPAMAAPGEPCLDGYLVEPGICELVYTSGTNMFTPTADMTQLEVLLVGGGGSGAELEEQSTNGYAAAGGGGEVLFVDATGVTDPIEAVVGGPGADSTVDTGSVATARAGHDGEVVEDSSAGGASGNLNSGATNTASGGGGAGSAVFDRDGGPGLIVADIVPTGSLFENDLSCYGGGGGAGNGNGAGVPGCGGGTSNADGTALIAPVANSGGGGGGVHTAQPAGAAAGASGIVKVRWNAAPVTITFNVLGKGTAPAPQDVVPGFPAVQPTAPTASGWEFKGWYYDEALTMPVDFSAPVVESGTYYAAWSPALAATGSGADLTVLPIALGALVAGAGALVATKRRRQA